MTLGRVGLVGRFRPLHVGAAAMLETLCEIAEELVIGIGSVNKYNSRNPFTADETENMIHVLLQDNYSNYSVVRVPDFAHKTAFENGEKWKEYLSEHLGELDYFISGNEYVSELLKDTYNVIHPVELIPKERQVFMKGTIVRVAMAQGESWKEMVPDVVSQYIVQNGLDERFRKEFGLETLAANLTKDYARRETIEEEKNHTYEA